MEFVDFIDTCSTEHGEKLKRYKNNNKFIDKLKINIYKYIY